MELWKKVKLWKEKKLVKEEKKVGGKESRRKRKKEIEIALPQKLRLHFYTAYMPSYIAIWLECVRNIAWALAALCCWCWMDTWYGIDHK